MACSTESNSIRTVPGFGIEGVVAGQRYRIGVAGFVAELRGEMRERGDDSVNGSRVVLGDEHALLAEFVLEDTLREDSMEAVSVLNRVGIQTEILSGDAPAAVATPFPPRNRNQIG